MLLVNGPVPVPSVVCKPPIVGPGAVDQHTPFAVTAPPPSAVTFPPDTALVAVIEVIVLVVRVGSWIEVAVNESSFP